MGKFQLVYLGRRAFHYLFNACKLNLCSCSPFRNRLVPPGETTGDGVMASPARVVPQEGGVTGVTEAGVVGVTGEAGAIGVLASPARVGSLDLHGMMIHGAAPPVASLITNPITSLSPSPSLHLLTQLVGKTMVGTMMSTTRLTWQIFVRNVTS